MSSGGHIRKRGVNSWQIKYDVPAENGGRRTVFRTVHGNKRDAQAELARRLTQIADGMHADPNQIRLASYIAGRIQLWYDAGAISPRTVEQYRNLHRRRIELHLGSLPLQKLRVSHLERWHITLRDAGLGGQSVKTIHQILARALKDAVRDNLIVRNVAVEHRAPRFKNASVEILTPEQVARLPVQLSGCLVRVPALLALFTGLRRSELLALQWGDIDFKRKVLHVRRAVEETQEHGLRVKETKTEAGRRTIGLSPATLNLLSQHRREQLELRLRLGAGRPADDAWVFPARGTNDLWSPVALSTAWRRFARKHELGVTFHALRHAHASVLIDANVDVVTISRRLGHASPDITLKVYAHRFQRDDTKAADAIDAALGNPLGGQVR